MCSALLSEEETKIGKEEEKEEEEEEEEVWGRSGRSRCFREVEEDIEVASGSLGKDVILCEREREREREAMCVTCPSPYL